MSKTINLKPNPLLYCSICEKSQHEVRYLLSASTVNICSACVALCNKLIQEKMLEEVRQIPAAIVWRDSMYSRQGTYLWLGQNKYVLNRKVSNRHGRDTYTSADGSEYAGEIRTFTWEACTESSPWSGTLYDKDGTVTATYLEGVRTEK